MAPLQGELLSEARLRDRPPGSPRAGESMLTRGKRATFPASLARSA